MRGAVVCVIGSGPSLRQQQLDIVRAAGWPVIAHIAAEGWAMVEWPDGTFQIWSIPEQADGVREAFPGYTVHIIGQPFVIVDNTRPPRRRLHLPSYSRPHSATAERG